MGNYLDFTFKKQMSEYIITHHKKQGLLRRIEYKLELGWALSKMYEHQLTINGPVIMHFSRGGGGGGFSMMVATFSHVGGFFNLFMATTGGVLMIPSFRIWSYLLHVEHISCVIMNCGQHHWAIPSLFSITLEALLEENITRKLLSCYFPYILFYRYLFSLPL